MNAKALILSKYIGPKDIDEAEDIIVTAAGLVMPRFTNDEMVLLMQELKNTEAEPPRAFNTSRRYLNAAIKYLEAGKNTWWGYLSELRIRINGGQQMTSKLLYPFLIEFEDLPLHLNEEEYPVSAIAKWRLKIGR